MSRLEDILKDMAVPDKDIQRMTRNGIMLDEDARQLGAKCVECGSRKVVYFISNQYANFQPGSYCYKHLLEKCRYSRLIPFPMPRDVLDSLKRDMGLNVDSLPSLYIPSYYEDKTK